MCKFFLLTSLIFSNITLLFAGAHKDTSVSTESPMVLVIGKDSLFGTLTMPANAKGIPVALLIAGSGPTDRDGNNPLMKNDCLKQLAHQLADRHIASLRYDKRGIGESKRAVISEADLRFENYVNDAKQWVDLLRKDNRFSNVVVIGHSEGSLIGMMAAGKADRFVSIAGAGRAADVVLKEQLGNQPKAIQDMCFPVIDSLKQGKLVSNVNPLLASLLRPSVQPYLVSWFRCDPQAEIKKLSLPILILQGTNDLNVSVQDAERLKAASPDSRLVLLNGMNHEFRRVSGDRQENLATYSSTEPPIDKDLAENISSFILNR